MKKIFKNVYPFIIVIISSFLFSYSVRAFINKAFLMTGGVSGVSLLLSRIIGRIYYDTTFELLLASEEYMNLVNSLTSIIYFIINIPIIILAFKKLGKRFSILSSLYIICNSFFIRFIGNDLVNIFNLNNDILAYSLFAGVLSGIAISLTLNVGGSSGGLEVIATYYSLKKQISIGKLLMIVNTIIIIIAGIVFKNPSVMLYTLVYIFVSGKVVDALHRFTNKKVIFVVCSNYEKISFEISNKTKYNSTLWKSVGGYTHNEKYTLMITLPEKLVDFVVRIILEVETDAFITTLDSNKVYRNFYIEPLR